MEQSACDKCGRVAPRERQKLPNGWRTLEGLSKGMAQLDVCASCSAELADLFGAKKQRLAELAAAAERKKKRDEAKRLNQEVDDEAERLKRQTEYEFKRERSALEKEKQRGLRRRLREFVCGRCNETSNDGGWFLQVVNRNSCRSVIATDLCQECSKALYPLFDEYVHGEKKPQTAFEKAYGECQELMERA